jgi:tetratricopeptide (TPR) repeat protein
MKICRKCNEEFSDKVTKCLYCGGPVETVFVDGEDVADKTKVIEESAGWDKIRQNYKIVIAAIAALLFIVALVIARSSSVKNQVSQTASSEKQSTVASVSSSLISTAAPSSAETVNQEPVQPASPDAFYFMKNAYNLCDSGRCSDPEKAIEYLNQAIKLRPDLAEAYNNRGNAYSDLKQYERALEDYNEAIRLKPDYAHAYYNRATTYSDLGRYQKAVEDYDTVIQLKPEETRAYLNRGSALFKLGNKELGCQDAQKACELGNCALLEKAQKKKDCP